MVSALFTEISNAMSSFITTLGSGVNAMTALFYTESSGSYTPTILGSLVAIVAGVGLVWFVFRLIIGLVRLRG